MNINSLFDKTSTLGLIVASFSCASCFPALATLGATVGLSFLTQYEGFFLNTMIPVTAWTVVVTNLIYWWSHRVTWRTAIAISGPLMVLATFHLFWSDSWSTNMFYFALGLMLLVSIWNIVSPPKKNK